LPQATAQRHIDFRNAGSVSKTDSGAVLARHFALDFRDLRLERQPRQLRVRHSDGSRRWGDELRPPYLVQHRFSIRLVSPTAEVERIWLCCGNVFE
jgi:hypothetical protein